MSVLRTHSGPIIFYDGSCGLCHFFIRFVLKFDKKEIFRFSPLQGSTIKNYLNSEVLDKLPQSICVVGDNRTYLKAYAVSYVFEKLGGVFKVINMFYSLLPIRLRNNIYDLISDRRHKLFGKKSEFCPAAGNDAKNNLFLP